LFIYKLNLYTYVLIEGIHEDKSFRNTM